jgi:hypothetical protein
LNFKAFEKASAFMRFFLDPWGYWWDVGTLEKCLLLFSAFGVFFNSYLKFFLSTISFYELEYLLSPNLDYP